MQNVRTRKIIGVVSIMIVCLTVVAGALPKPPPPFFRHVPRLRGNGDESVVFRPFEQGIGLLPPAPYPRLTFLQEDTHGARPGMRPFVPRLFVLNRLKNRPRPPHGMPLRLFFTLRFSRNAVLPPNLPNFERFFQMVAEVLTQPSVFESPVITHAVPVSAAHIASLSPSTLHVFRL